MAASIVPEHLGARRLLDQHSIWDCACRGTQIYIDPELAGAGFQRRQRSCQRAERRTAARGAKWRRRHLARASPTISFGKERENLTSGAQSTGRLTPRGPLYRPSRPIYGNRLLQQPLFTIHEHSSWDGPSYRRLGLSDRRSRVHLGLDARVSDAALVGALRGARSRRVERALTTACSSIRRYVQGNATMKGISTSSEFRPARREITQKHSSGRGIIPCRTAMLPPAGTLKYGIATLNRSCPKMSASLAVWAGTTERPKALRSRDRPSGQRRRIGDRRRLEAGRYGRERICHQRHFRSARVYLTRATDFLIGDGALRYGPEYIWEATTARGLFRASSRSGFTARHRPGLHRDRGPVWTQPPPALGTSPARQPGKFFTRSESRGNSISHSLVSRTRS